MTIALFNDDLKNHEYENVGLQAEIRAKDQQIAILQRHHIGYLSDEDKNNGISIIVKNNEEEEYPYIYIYMCVCVCVCADNMVIEDYYYYC